MLRRASRLMAACIAGLLRHLKRDGADGNVVPNIIAAGGGVFIHCASYRCVALSQAQYVCVCLSAASIIVAGSGVFILCSSYRCIPLSQFELYVLTHLPPKRRASWVLIHASAT